MKIWDYIKKGLFWITIGTILLIVFFFVESLNKDSESFYRSILNGIISGIVTALLIFIFQVIWKKNIMVWIENLLYQDVCIEGDWSGFIVHHIGLKDIDQIQKDLAWKAFKEAMRKKKIYKETENEEKSEKVEASEINPETGEEKELSAEVILHSNKSSDKEQNQTTAVKTERIKILPQPIMVKAEIRRKGHSITGRFIETGGASDIHTYQIWGTFKNLILTATYESISKDHIDRGALSLMLLKNGEILEGFFSSYGDGNHRITPMRCVLTKRNKINDTEE